MSLEHTLYPGNQSLKILITDVSLSRISSQNHKPSGPLDWLPFAHITSKLADLWTGKKGVKGAIYFCLSYF